MITPLNAKNSQMHYNVWFCSPKSMNTLHTSRQHYPPNGRNHKIRHHQQYLEAMQQPDAMTDLRCATYRHRTCPARNYSTRMLLDATANHYTTIHGLIAWQALGYLWLRLWRSWAKSSQMHPTPYSRDGLNRHCTCSP